MKTIIKVIKLTFRILNYWFFIIPVRLNLIAMGAYFLILYLSFEAISLNDIEPGIFRDLSGVFLGIPCLISLFSFLAPSYRVGDEQSDSLDKAINYRNLIASNSCASEAYSIMKKTAHLDVIRNSSGEAFQNAKKGFNSTVGNKSSADIYNDLINK